jgi:hypothetical protein
MSEKEVLKIYDRSRPLDEDLYDSSTVNHVALTLAVLFGLIAIWLSIALINAENQRYALMTNKCVDPVFKAGVDKQCLITVRSRDHWWEHWWYATTHVMPEKPKGRR